MSDHLLQSLRKLFSTPDPACLGPERRQSSLSEAEVRAGLRAAISDSSPPETQDELILALLLLWHDHLDASHTISQRIEALDGSFLHAMMHRREPDYWNSKYWWRRAGHHPAFNEIGRRAIDHLQSAGRSDLLQTLVRNAKWDPAAFVNACEAVANRSTDDPEVMLLRELQRIEFDVLLARLVAG